MPDDPRDLRRIGDSLHDTVDESSGVVRDAVDPDNTPVDKLIAAIRTEVGGYLTARDELMLREYEKHRERVQERSEKKRPPPPPIPPPEVARAQLASLLEHDMASWEPFTTMRTRLGKLEAVEEGRTKTMRGLKAWVLSGVGAAVLALGGGLIDYGTRRGKSQAEADRVERDRAALVEAVARNHAQDTEIGVLKALVRRLERETNNRDGDE